MAKMQKAKREDFRLDEELRTSKAKYEESSEDVFRRMQDIKEAEADSVRDLTSFLDCELDYYERCADELRRVKQEWVASQGQLPPSSRPSELSLSRRPTNRSRSNTAQSYSERSDRTERWANRQDIYEEDEPAPEPVRMPIRSSPYRSNGSVTPEVQRPSINRSSTIGGAFEGPSSRQSSYREAPLPPPESLRKTPTAPPPNMGSLRNNLRPVNRIQTNQNLSPDVFVDEYDTATSSGSPEYDRSESPATSYGSLSRTASNNGLRNTGAGTVKKAPPPPPPSRAKKPAPPVPARREMGY